VKPRSLIRLAARLERRAEALNTASLGEARRLEGLESEIVAAACRSRALFQSGTIRSSLCCAASEWHLERTSFERCSLRARISIALESGARAVGEQRHWARLRCGLERRMKKIAAGRPCAA